MSPLSQQRLFRAFTFYPLRHGNNKKDQHSLLLKGVAFEDRMMQSCCSEMVKTDHFLGLPKVARTKIHELLMILSDDSVRHKALIEDLANKYHE